MRALPGCRRALFRRGNLPRFLTEARNFSFAPSGRAVHCNVQFSKLERRGLWLGTVLVAVASGFASSATAQQAPEAELAVEPSATEEDPYADASSPPDEASANPTASATESTPTVAPSEGEEAAPPTASFDPPPSPAESQLPDGYVLPNLEPSAPEPSTQPVETGSLSAPPPSGALVLSDGLGAPPKDMGASKNGAKNRPFGAMLNVGVPEILLMSFIYQPVGYVRMNAGVAYNAISPGINVGVTALPLGYGWSPTLSFDYGHYFEGDASGLVEAIAGPSETEVSPANNVGYDYVNIRGGIEYGGDRFVFFTRAGVSWLRTEIRNLNEYIESEAGEASDTTSISIPKNPILSVWAPSFSFGMIVRL